MQKSIEKTTGKDEFKKRLYNYIIRLVKFLSLLQNNGVTREIISQLMRSGTSVGANYFEAQAASSKKDYPNYFSHSLKSANESKFWLSILSDSNLLPKELAREHEWLLQETGELANIFASSILTMKGYK
jgi:four helix bundle protein